MNIVEVIQRTTELMNEFVSLRKEENEFKMLNIRITKDVERALEILEREAAELALLKFELSSMNWFLFRDTLTVGSNSNLSFSIKNLRSELRDLLFAVRDYSALLQERMRTWRMFYTK